MKYIKTSIGKIAFIPCDCTREESLKLVPKDCRLMKRWELLKLFDEEKNKLKDFVRYEYITTKPLACVLYNDQYFIADFRDSNVTNRGVRGVAVVKIE